MEEAFRISVTRGEGTGLEAGDPLCPGGQTASPVIGPPDDNGGSAPYTPLPATANFISLNVADGEETRRPVKFSFANAKAYALNFWHGVLYTTTSQSCNGSPNEVWAIDVSDPNPKGDDFQSQKRRAVGTRRRCD